jgi:hypothetical protein
VNLQQQEEELKLKVLSLVARTCRRPNESLLLLTLRWVGP